MPSPTATMTVRAQPNRRRRIDPPMVGALVTEAGSRPAGTSETTVVMAHFRPGGTGISSLRSLWPIANEEYAENGRVQSAQRIWVRDQLPLSDADSDRAGPTRCPGAASVLPSLPRITG